MHAFGVCSEILNVPPSDTTPSYTWSAGQSGNKTVTITNGNELAMSISMGAWTGDAGFGWTTSFPLVIAAGGSESLTAHWTGTEPADQLDGASSGTWSVTGGGSGGVSATGTKYGSA